MGAVVVNDALTVANWSAAKPKDYKNGELDKALGAWEAVAKKALPDPKLSGKPSVKEHESFVKEAKALMAVLKEQDSALGAVVAAASKCETECRKVSEKLEGEAGIAYFSAAGTAAAIGSNAGRTKSKLT